MRSAAPAIALAACLALAGSARAATLDWLHVEANTGGSSGGHAALRLGDLVFEFQHGEGGTLRLRRSDWDGFRYRTTVRGNRTIHAARVELTGAEHERLVRAFDEQLLAWDRHFEVWDALRADRELLERLLAGRAGRDASDALATEGAGLFEWRAGAGASASTQALRARVAARHGERFLDDRLRAFEARLAALTPATEPAPRPRIEPDRLPRREYGFSERRRDLVQWIAALRALERAAPLRAGVLRDPGAGALALDAAETAGLAAWGDALQASLVTLAASERVDGGLALLVGIARLDAVDRSLAAGRLVLLDDFPAGAEAHETPAGDPYLIARRAHADARLAQARAELAASEPLDEAGYDALEEAGNDWLELEGALAHGRPLRLADGERIPAPAAAIDGLAGPRIADRDLRRAVLAARERERDTERALREAFGYQLVTRNCVTELFATLAAAGGPVEPPGALRFVPFASLDAVQASWPVAQRWEEPAFRRARLAALYAAENDLRVWLRESNTLTSTLYRRDPDDGFFLFFTDDTPWLRPLLGAANLAAAAGEAAVGLVRLPFDRGAMLRNGLEGALWSLPELAFVDIRKGALRYGPPLAPDASLARRAAAPSAP
jgi:hypothetical protein